MMGPYNPTELLAILIDKLKKGREFAISGYQTISDAMMTPKGITLLAQTGIFNDDIREWRQQYVDLKTWMKYIYIFHRVHREQKRAVTTTEKGGYTATVQKIYGSPLTSPEDHHELIKDIQTIVQVMRTQGCELEGLAQANEVLTSPKSTVMAQLAHMTVTMNNMQAQLKKLASAQKQPIKAKRKVIILELREKFHSQEQNLLRKGNGASRGRVLQKNDWWQRKGM